MKNDLTKRMLAARVDYYKYVTQCNLAAFATINITK